MKNVSKNILVVYIFSIFFSIPAFSQQSTVYVSVLSSAIYVVGAANSQTGLYYQHPSDDTVWQHSGPTRIRAFSVAVDPTKRGERILIGSGNGVHETEDGGKSWRITTDWKITEVLCVKIDPANLNRIFITTPYGIYKSDDNASTWTPSIKGLKNSTFVSSIVINRHDSNILYCSTEDGVYISTDGGEKWQRTELSVPGIRTIDENPKKPGMLIAGTENNGIYISQDGGKIWKKAEGGIDHATFYVIAFDPNNTDIIYAGGYVTGVYKTTDGGNSWRRFSEGLANLNIHSIAVDPTNSERIYAGTMGDGVYRSEDGGKLWKFAGLSNTAVWTIFVLPF
jgi:photosystem II stability/assembly factor-like uncharacterized protein